MKSFLRPFTAVAAFFLFTICSGAVFGQSYWTPSNIPIETTRLQVQKGAWFQFDAAMAYAAIGSGENPTIAIPGPDGKLDNYHLTANATMHEELAGRYPEIKTFNTRSVSNPHHWGKVSVTPQGFHAMIFIPGKPTWFVDPAMGPQSDLHVAYAKSDFLTDKLANCLTTETDPKAPAASLAKSGAPYNSCQLRTYRLAVAATGEYSIFHGGTQQLAMAAIVVTMNRVSGIYERDFSVTFTLIPNNEIIVYTNPASDPYTNGNAGTMLGENQAHINSVIGASNYDVGHVFGTNSGGVAGFGVTCINNSKARGVTGSAAPIGDPFDVDYVAHEIGHQFGGSHSFNNSCGGNRSDAQAVEPGSGSTIMAYAGICNPNVQNNSDDHFHGINMREIGIRISNDNCPVLTSLSNTMPTIADLPAEIFIPVSTPFALTANAVDLEGDALTWCWEQMDAEISTQPPLTSASTGPSFRSYTPADIPTRYFPRLQTIAFNQPTTWEQLPSVSRQMTFRVSVRDNSPAGGCTQWADIEVNTNSNAGPFVVLYPSTAGITWPAFSNQTVTWDVANTTAAPISADLVDIYLSTNSGSTFPILLAQGVPNTGAHNVQVPNIGTTLARVVVINSEGTFFDMSNANFTITQISDGFAFESGNLNETVCQNDDLIFSFETLGIGSFAESIDLSIANQPPGATVVLSQESALPGEVVQVTVSNTGNTPGGNYDLTITGNGPSFSNEITFVCGIINTTPLAAQPVSPADGAIGINSNASLGWLNNASLTETYTVQVATDVLFSNIVFESAGLSANAVATSGLVNESTYYWRVFNNSDCGISNPSAVYSFTTFQCLPSAAATVPVIIQGEVETSAISSIAISQAGTVGAVKVTGVQGQHANIADLVFKVISPVGTSAVLASGSCGLGVTLFGNETIQINSPSSVAGVYVASVPAGFGPGISSLGISGIAVLADDGGAAAELCDPAINSAALNGNIAMVFRGSCNFATKVQNAQDAGAIAVIVINNQNPGVIPMGGTATGINISAVMISLANGTALLNAQAASATNFNFSFDDAATTGAITCPATGGFTYQPQETLSIFEGEEAQGAWFLEVVNLSGQAQGVLNAWTLELCYADGLTNAVSASAAQASLYPNPTNGVLKIIPSPEMKVQRIVVFDMAGRIVKSKNVNPGANIELEMGELANGLYMVQLQGSGAAATYRVVKGE